MDKILKLLLAISEMHVAQRVRRVSGAATWLVLAALAGLGALAAAVAALWIFLIPRLGADAAALSIAGVLALLSGLFVLVARATLHPQPAHAAAENAGDDLASVKELFAQHKGTALLAALVAGLAMGNERK